MGGKAIQSSRPIKQFEIPSTYKKIIEDVLIPLGLTEDQYTILGSAGKKANLCDTSGDLDIGIYSPKVAETLNCDFSVVLHMLEGHLQRLGYETYLTVGFGLVSFGFPIQSLDEGIVQVDLILSDSIEWAKFANYSPDFRKGESRFKGLYRNALLAEIALNTIYSEIRNENGDLVEIDRLAISLARGLLRIKNSYIGKSGNLIKTANRSSNVVVTTDPQELVNILCGECFTPEDMNSYESIRTVIDNPKFKLYEKREKILKGFAEGINDRSFPIPWDLLDLKSFIIGEYVETFL